MKRLRIPLLVLTFALGVSACGNSVELGAAKPDGALTAGEAKPDGALTVGEAKPDGALTAGAAKPGGTPMAEEAKPDGTSVAENANGRSDASLEAPVSSADSAEGEENPDGHSHALMIGDNVVEHEAMGYCGNTVTTVSRGTWQDGEPWEASFWGSDSVALTDLLLYLDYSGDICRCQPEYTVDTEFGEGYGVNLTEGYVRYNGGQVSLTAEQVEQIQEILDRQMESSGATG